MSVTLKTGSMVLLAGLVSAILFLCVPPISQMPEFHSFADNRSVFGIPNFWNVVSNFPFLIVGFLGAKHLQQARLPTRLTLIYKTIFWGVILVFAGSSFFHWEPNIFSLMFDRLPMTLVFMSLLTVVIAEYVSERGAQVLWIPLLTIGIVSVVYWYWSETQNAGDLRLYLLVQFLPMLLIPIMLLCFSTKYSSSKGYWQLLACYVVAKLAEHYDRALLDWSGFISGHSIKHIVAAVGLYYLLKHFLTRKDLTLENTMS
jgi:hypothetical protein